MKTVFVGAVEGSRIALETLCAAGHPPAMVVTLPLDLAHRHSDFADLGPVAERHAVPVHRTKNSNDPKTLEAIAALNPELILIIGWSQLVHEAFRALPRLGCIGFHPAPLPRLRGRAVIPWTILLGETDGGATLFWIDGGTDTGDIAAQATFAIDPVHETAATLYEKHMEALRSMLPPLMAEIASGTAPRRKQASEGASTCAKRVREDGRIDWRAPAEAVHRLIRAVGEPYPCAFTTDDAGGEIVIRSSRLRTDRYFIGLPGQVQALADGGFTVMCGDGHCVEVLDWTGRTTPPKLHGKLG